MYSTASVTVNQRAYNLPSRPVVVVCLDGSATEYFDAALVRGLMPNLARMSLNGWRGFARAAMPTFTNVNNTSIVTGTPPSVHGIGGNFFYDTAQDQEVMMNSSKFLRVETIFPAVQKAGRKVAVVTAKEKLRDIFASGLINEGGIAFSAEKAAQAVKASHGIDEVESIVGPTPEIYSGDASLYVLKAGVVLLERGIADFLYLSTTDYMQHKHAPEEQEALDFYAGIDTELGRLVALGAVVGVTADHGMNAKQKADGTPNVIYLESELDAQFGGGFRVILPITDPYVVHHGALGSFAQVHVPASVEVQAVQTWLLGRSGVTECHTRAVGAKLLELPEDRMGDLVVASARDVVLGRTPAYHDLKALAGGLRSHGGRYEEMVPFVFSQPLKPEYAARATADPRNFDIFEFTCNGTL
ncbi:phosphonoacetate hydrolase [Verrucomicrobium spinosum]|uniref:phosphonoacetate hydrolase n=1 Tax=Verrucomicrobium spinosum TaxID=2736 RepID=UPI00017466D9|nr:phosphonoacetate hydrolase [Verrucomicrobium spinosum]